MSATPGDLMAALHRLMIHARNDRGVAGALERWPNRAEEPATPPAANTLPVLGGLPALPHPGPGAAGTAFDLVCALAPSLPWRQSYDAADFGAGFLDNYGWVMLAGDTGVYASEKLLVTLLMLGPETRYPLHSHAPEEIYQVIAGDVEITSGDRGTQPYRPGMTCHHPPWISHALQTGKDPVLLLAVWQTGVYAKSRIDFAPGMKE